MTAPRPSGQGAQKNRNTLACRLAARAIGAGQVGERDRTGVNTIE